MGRIVAIGGGELDTTHAINRHIVAMAGKQHPCLLFLGTASHDSEGYIAAIHSEFEALGCTVTELCLATGTCSDDEIDRKLYQADIIYAGGGDTAFMMETWKKHGLDQKLKAVYREGRAVLSGLSAGAMCWFRCGHSDSSVLGKGDTLGYGWVNDLLDLHSYALCPHYDERVERFDEMIREKPFPGLALENNVAFVEQNGRISFLATADSAKAYWIRCVDGKLEKQEQPVRVL